MRTVQINGNSRQWIFEMAALQRSLSVCKDQSMALELGSTLGSRTQRWLAQSPRTHLVSEMDFFNCEGMGR